MKTPRDMKRVNDLIHNGPLTIVLVYSPSCPHCHTYMPLWKELCESKGRTANMVSVKADTYMQTPLAEKMPVESVPTVLFVDKNGQVQEANEPRNMPVMKTAASLGLSESQAILSTPANLRPIQLTSVPIQEVETLSPLPAMPVPTYQRGGSDGCGWWKKLTTGCPNTAATLSDLPEPLPASQTPSVDRAVSVEGKPTFLGSILQPSSEQAPQIGGGLTPWGAFVSSLKQSRRRPAKKTRKQRRSKFSSSVRRRSSRRR